MRECDIGEIIVLVGDWLFGILTDRYIVVRALAGGLEPEPTKVGEICSREPTTVGPTASVSHAARLMRDNAIRRLPVVDGARHVMGVVSIGATWSGKAARASAISAGRRPPGRGQARATG